MGLRGPLQQAPDQPEYFSLSKTGDVRKKESSQKVLVKITVDPGRLNQTKERLIGSFAQKLFENIENPQGKFGPDIDVRREGSGVFSVHFKKPEGASAAEKPVTPEFQIVRLTVPSVVTKAAYEKAKKVAEPGWLQRIILYFQQLWGSYKKERSPQVEALMSDVGCNNYSGFQRWMKAASEIPGMKQAEKTAREIAESGDGIIEPLSQEIKGLKPDEKWIVPLGYYRTDEDGNRR